MEIERVAARLAYIYIYHCNRLPQTSTQCSFSLIQYILFPLQFSTFSCSNPQLRPAHPLNMHPLWIFQDHFSPNGNSCSRSSTMNQDYNYSDFLWCAQEGQTWNAKLHDIFRITNIKFLKIWKHGVPFHLRCQFIITYLVNKIRNRPQGEMAFRYWLWRNRINMQQHYLCYFYSL